MRTVDIHWLAGLWEGEGSFYSTLPHKTYPRMALGMTDLDVVRRAQRLMGGTVNTQSTRKNAKKPIHVLRFYGKKAIGWSLTLYPLLGKRRREQIEAMIQKWKSRALTKP